MMAPFKISSRKERLCSGAKSMGNGRVEQTRRIKGGGTMRKTSTRLRGENFLPSKNFTPDFSAQSEQQAAAEFSAVIIDFSAGQLARARSAVGGEGRALMRHHVERPELDEATRRKIVALRRDNGLTYRMLSERFGRSLNTVRGICVEAGVEADPRGRRTTHA
jgi:hypothetical protein